MIQIYKDAMLLAANAIFRTDGVIQTTLRLFRSNMTISPLNELDDFNEANFSGYEGVAVPWDTPTWGEPTNQVVVETLDVCAFTHDGGGVNNNIFGWYLTLYNVDEDTTVLLAAQKYNDAPRPMNSGGDVITEKLTGFVLQTAADV